MAQTTYFRVTGRDTHGEVLSCYAAYRQQEVVLFDIKDGRALVLHLFKCPDAQALRGVIREHVMDVDHLVELSGEDKPQYFGARLPVPTRWTEMQRGILGVILETQEVK